MEDFVGDLLYPFMGGIYLWVRYGNKGKVQAILKSEFDNSYQNIGSIKIIPFHSRNFYRNFGRIPYRNNSLFF